MALLDSPRTRRLKADHQALAQLAADSTIFQFEAFGSPPDFYVLRYRGRGLEKRCLEKRGLEKQDAASEVHVRELHEVHIRLGSAYPRLMPELAWKSPVFHPNISLSGVVCLGGYGTFWVPSLALADLCTMLWDMVRYANFDESSPYNREAAAWAKTQKSFELPLDPRPLRDKLSAGEKQSPNSALALARPTRPALPPDIVFLGDVTQAEATAEVIPEVIVAELVPPPAERDAVLFVP